jgi:hypothetical protein
MSAEIIMFVPKTNPNRQHDLERQAIEIANVAFPSVLTPTVRHRRHEPRHRQGFGMMSEATVYQRLNFGPDLP